ncbi:MAG: hypothetical protein Q7P63_08670 [Verrucomicrobiota bacterium JB022]|nr:hypothetical protein [Verrucomicrobiota bacterium JB022]
MNLFNMRAIHCLALAGVSLCASLSAQVTISQVEVGNVSARQFDVLWQVSDISATPTFAVYSDATGTTPITDQVEVEFYPVKAGDPEVGGNGTFAERQALQGAVAAQGLVWVRVGDLQPGVTYYFATGSVDGSGTPNLANDPGIGTATTASDVAFVSEARQVMVALSQPADGAIVRLDADDSAYPLFAAVGDGAAASAAYFDLAHVLNAAGLTNFDFTTPMPLTLTVLGEDAPAGAQALTVDFDGTYTVAASQMVMFQGETGSVVSFVFDPIGDQRSRVPFVISIAAVDSNGVIVRDFTGTVELTSSATLEQGGGTTAAFTNGELLVHTVALAGEGAQTLTATHSGGATGTSDLFDLLPTFTYNEWATDVFGGSAGNPDIAGMLRDPDGDGRSNLLEFAYGLNPLISDAGARQPRGEGEEGTDQVAFTYFRLKDRLGLAYQVEQAPRPDGPWTSVLAAESTETVVDVDATTEQVTLRMAAPATGERLFLRLKVVTD